MASEGYDRRRERLSYTGIKEETAEETESEFVEVPIELKGHVIGRGGCMLQEIMRQSGARISSQSKEEKGFLVNGDKEQRAYAKKLILEKVEGVQFTLWELVKIPGEYKGLVMGTDGAKLREISAQTGAKVIHSYKDGEVYIKLGNHDQRKNARALIGNAVSAGKMRGIERDSNKVSRYIDGFNLPGNKVKLKQVQNKEEGTTVISHSQFRLKPAQVYETQESSNSQSYSYLDYKRLLMKDVLMTLKKINHSLGAEKPKADMWCHFGRFNIRVHREGI
ncbi:uncharacterized protein [Porites lutea]|uniref:uncharacterized protein n=1 Tax=Porites lutea TaxID=51062 RepID=UPI003CC58684